MSWMYKGKVMTTNITEPITEGMQVYWDGCPSKVKIWFVIKIEGDRVMISPSINSPRAQSPNISELKTLIIKYDEPQISNFEFGPVETHTIPKQVPIKKTQWKVAVRNGVVDKNILVNFHITVYSFIQKSEAYFVNEIISVKENIKPIEKQRITFQFLNIDSAPYFGAYLVNSLKSGKPIIAFNMEAIIHTVKDLDIKEATKELKDILLQTLTHEFCHALQDFFEVELNELQVEEILGAYNKEWDVFTADEGQESDPSTFLIEEFLDTIETIQPEKQEQEYLDGFNNFKEQVQNLFYPFMKWREANKQFISKSNNT